ncbi:MAG: hypothetical protein ABIH21_02155 [Patescibacteria group bacterium]
MPTEPTQAGTAEKSDKSGKPRFGRHAERKPDRPGKRPDQQTVHTEIMEAKPFFEAVGVETDPDRTHCEFRVMRGVKFLESEAIRRVNLDPELSKGLQLVLYDSPEDGGKPYIAFRTITLVSPIYEAGEKVGHVTPLARDFTPRIGEPTDCACVVFRNKHNGYEVLKAGPLHPTIVAKDVFEMPAPFKAEVAFYPAQRFNYNRAGKPTGSSYTIALAIDPSTGKNITVEGQFLKYVEGKWGNPITVELHESATRFIAVPVVAREELGDEAVESEVRELAFRGDDEEIPEGKFRHAGRILDIDKEIMSALVMTLKKAEREKITTDSLWSMPLKELTILKRKVTSKLAPDKLHGTRKSVTKADEGHRASMFSRITDAFNALIKERKTATKM